VADTQLETDKHTREPELPGLLGEVFLEIENEVIALHAEWGVYRRLFEKEEDWKLLAESSAYGWPILHDALVERCILRISRLTDPALSQQSTDKENLSFAYLVRLLQQERHDELCEALEPQLGAMKEGLKPLIELRNKALAHSDMSVGLEKKHCPVVSVNMINGLLPRIADLCQNIRSHFGLAHFHYDMCIGAWAGEIVADARRLRRFDELYERVCDAEPLDVYQLRRAIMDAGREQA
jgi:hypothetical protein